MPENKKPWRCWLAAIAFAAVGVATPVAAAGIGRVQVSLHDNNSALPSAITGSTYTCNFYARVDNATRYHLTTATIELSTGTIRVPDVAARSTLSGVASWNFQAPAEYPSCEAAARALAKFFLAAKVGTCQMEAMVEGDCQDQFVFVPQINFGAEHAYDLAATAIIRQRAAQAKVAKDAKDARERAAAEAEQKRQQQEAIENAQSIAARASEDALRAEFSKIESLLRAGRVGRLITLRFTDIPGAEFKFIRTDAETEQNQVCLTGLCYQLLFARSDMRDATSFYPDDPNEKSTSAGRLLYILRFHILQGCDEAYAGTPCAKCPPDSPKPHLSSCGPTDTLQFPYRR